MTLGNGFDSYNVLDEFVKSSSKPKINNLKPLAASGLNFLDVGTGFVYGIVHSEKSNMISISALIGYEGIVLSKTESITKELSKLSKLSNYASELKGLKYAGLGVGAHAATAGLVESISDGDFSLGNGPKLVICMGTNNYTIWGPHME